MTLVPIRRTMGKIKFHVVSKILFLIYYCQEHFLVLIFLYTFSELLSWYDINYRKMLS